MVDTCQAITVEHTLFVAHGVSAECTIISYGVCTEVDIDAPEQPCRRGEEAVARAVGAHRLTQLPIVEDNACVRAVVFLILGGDLAEPHLACGERATVQRHVGGLPHIANAVAVGLADASQPPLGDDLARLHVARACVTAADTRRCGVAVGVDRAVAVGDLPPVAAG